MRRASIVSLLLTGCFEQAPTIDGESGGVGSSSGDTSGASSDTSSGGETGGGAAFCAVHAGAIACLDFEASDVLPAIGEQLTRNGGTLGIIEDGFASSRALAAILMGMLDGVAVLRIDHTADGVRHAFALRLEPDCVPPDAGVVLASFGTFVTPEVEAARVELVLLPDQRLGLRKGPGMADMTPGPVVAEIASPPAGEWATIVWEVELDSATISMSIGDGTQSDSGMAVALGTLGDGRRSGIGLASPAATTCTVSIDDVLFEAK